MSVIASANPDSRRAPRVPLLRDVDCIGSGPRGRGRLADLSVGGAFLELLPPPPVGALLTLRFRPLDSEPPLLVRAEVVYVQAGLGAGCRFVAPEEAVRAQLEQLVQHHLAAPRREEMRRSGRVMVDIAVTLAGRDAGGDAFEETGVLVTLSRNGAALALGHRPQMGAPLLVRWAGREFRTTVVWVGDGAQPGQVRVGIQNRGLARAFGFEFPAPSSAGEPPPIAVERAGTDDLPAALALLRQAQLPEDGVADGFRDYVVVRDGARLAGLCGLETYGAHGLLRSLVVSPEHRGSGLGESLVDEIVTRAAARGLKDVYLLTATARDFFLRQGFVDLPREQAPDSIRQSWEFRAGCPGTAAFMRRPLASSR